MRQAGRHNGEEDGEATAPEVLLSLLPQVRVNLLLHPLVLLQQLAHVLVAGQGVGDGVAVVGQLAALALLSEAGQPLERAPSELPGKKRECECT